jgi:hypothetical protein
VEEEELEVEDDDDDDALEHGRRKRKVAFLPSLGTLALVYVLHILQASWRFTDTTHTIYYRGHWLRVSLLNGYFHNGLNVSRVPLRSPGQSVTRITATIPL